jgi:molybdate transport system permease protein
MLGKQWPTTMWRIVMPLSRAGLATAAVLTFAHTIGEFGVVLMVGGNIPGQTRTVSISVYDAVQSFDYAAAAQTSLFLLLFSLVVLTATYALQRRGTLVWPGR